MQCVFFFSVTKSLDNDARYTYLLCLINGNRKIALILINSILLVDKALIKQVNIYF